PGTRTGRGLPAAQPTTPLAEPARQSQPTPTSDAPEGQSGHAMSGGLPHCCGKLRLRGKAVCRALRGVSVWDDAYDTLHLDLLPHTDTLEEEPGGGFPR